jgi:hypothetical protein
MLRISLRMARHADRSEKTREIRRPDRSNLAMKLCTGWVASAVLILAATASAAQVPGNQAGRAPYVAASDFEGPYGGPEIPPPRPAYQGYRYGYERPPGLMPAEDVYAVLRENGFSPLGIPRQRGLVYTIAVVDRRGDDGRLVIDARDGRIVRFQPAYGMAPGWGPRYDEDAVAPYGPQGAMPPPTVIRGAPRPPASIPHVASRTVPLPKAAPPRGEAPAAAAKPAEPAPQAETPQQSAAAQAKPAEPAATVGQAKPAPAILPTQQMPPAQGLD